MQTEKLLKKSCKLDDRRVELLLKKEINDAPAVDYLLMSIVKMVIRYTYNYQHQYIESAFSIIIYSIITMLEKWPAIKRDDIKSRPALKKYKRAREKAMDELVLIVEKLGAYKKYFTVVVNDDEIIRRIRYVIELLTDLFPERFYEPEEEDYSEFYAQLVKHLEGEKNEMHNRRNKHKEMEPCLPIFEELDEA